EKDRLDREYTDHIAEARKAMTDKNYKLAEAEANLALKAHAGDTEAASIRDEAHKLGLAKPADKTLNFTFKTAVKGKWSGMWSVSADAAGNVYALDRETRHMVVIDPDFRITKDVALPYKYPDRVFVDAKGRVWVTEWGNISKINIVDKESFVALPGKSFGGLGDTDGKFNWLTDIAVSPDGGTVWGMDSKHWCVQALETETGRFKSRAG